MKTVAVIFGGKTAEHDVSIITALAAVIRPLELLDEYEVIPVYIAKDGTWYSDDKLMDIDLYRSGRIDEFLHKAPKVHIEFGKGLTIVKSSQFAGRKRYKKIDIVFPAMHGTHGEDGELMGVLEMANVPYVGCGVAASAIAMDKVLSKQIAASANIPSTPWIWFKANDLEKNYSSVIERIKPLKLPLFVKPARLGSSIGISKVTDDVQLNNALEVAAHFDDKIIVEQGVANLIEVTLPIVGNEHPEPAFLEQPLLKSEDFFDFETKYMGQGKKMGKKLGNKRGSQGYSKIPAELPKQIYDMAVKTGLQVYSAVGCEGIARVDMLIDSKAEKVYFNEINPMPGSLYAHNWRAKGVSSVELIARLLRLAEERYAKKQKIETTFVTNFLKQF